MGLGMSEAGASSDYASLIRLRSGLAPTHAAMQRLLGLMRPSVNSMLIRLEQRGFIRRTPGVARGIEISIDPALIPPLEQPFTS